MSWSRWKRLWRVKQRRALIHELVVVNAELKRMREAQKRNQEHNPTDFSQEEEKIERDRWCTREIVSLVMRRDRATGKLGYTHIKAARFR